METGWTGEGPEERGPALPLTGRLMDMREHQASPLEAALARSHADEARQARDEAAAAPDPDERAANMIARGVLPGQMSGLSQRLGATLAELASEEAKLERAARRQERIARDHAAGRITVFDIARMQAADIDEGDPGQVARLERQAAALRQRILAASELMAPQRERLDPLEAASRHAHDVFREVTRQRWAEAQSGRPAPRPFASAGRFAAGDTEHTGAGCRICAEGRRRDAARAAAAYAAEYPEIAR